MLKSYVVWKRYWRQRIPSFLAYRLQNPRSTLTGQHSLHVTMLLRDTHSMVYRYTEMIPKLD